MALIVPLKCAPPQLPARVSGRRLYRVSAALSTPPQKDTPPVDWAKETTSFFEQDLRPIMLFDGVCNLCNGGVKFVRDNDRRRNIRFEALQSESGRKLLQRSGRAPDDISSVVLVEKDRRLERQRSNVESLLDIMAVKLGCPKKLMTKKIGEHFIHALWFRKEKSYIKSEAVLKIMEYIDLPFPQLALFLQLVPLFVRDFVYENIADNRYNIFGRSDSCEI